jgi:hypothetical protein
MPAGFCAYTAAAKQRNAAKTATATASLRVLVEVIISCLLVRGRLVRPFAKKTTNG